MCLVEKGKVFLFLCLAVGEEKTTCSAIHITEPEWIAPDPRALHGGGGGGLSLIKSAAGRCPCGRKELNDCSCRCSQHLCLDPQYPLDIIMGWLHIPGTFGLIWMIKENEIYVPDTCQLAIIMACIYIMSSSKNLKAPCLWKLISDQEKEIILFPFFRDLGAW